MFDAQGENQARSIALPYEAVSSNIHSLDKNQDEFEVAQK